MPNPVIRHGGIEIPQMWRESGLNRKDPYSEKLFDENHVALVFMNLNDYYGLNMSFIGGNAVSRRSLSWMCTS